MLRDGAYAQYGSDAIASDETSWRNYGIADSVADGVVVGQVDTLGRPAGLQGYPGFRLSDEVDTDRTNIATFADVEVNLTPELLVTAAFRWKYSKWETFSSY